MLLGSDRSGLDALRERFDAFLVDLDGTLLDGRAKLTERTTRAVRRLVDAGFEVVLCTGRSAAGTRRIHAALGLPTPFVSYNGAWIGRPGETPWRCEPIPDHLLPHVACTERRARFSFRHHDERKYTSPSDHGEHAKVAGWYENVVHVRDPRELPSRNLMRVSLYFDGDVGPEDAWGALEPDARGALHRETFPLRIFPEFPESSLVLCEVQGKSRGKAEAFEWLRRERGISAERTIAVGDQANDLPMLAVAGLAVVTANAVDAARREADLVIGHHAEEGFAAWVEAGAPTAAGGLEAVRPRVPVVPAPRLAADSNGA
jgi:hydroxymethylpyrimidine pyrophosphatase-like HAD family hydrolase